MNGTTATAVAMFLPPQQARVLELVERYYTALEEPCPSHWVATKLHKHHKTVREQFSVLARKGWLQSDATPAVPAKPYLNKR